MGSVTNFPRRAKGGVAFEPAPKRAAPRADLHAYEHEERRKIAEKDWAKVHVVGDRREPLDWVSRPRRFILDALSLKARKG